MSFRQFKVEWAGHVCDAGWTMLIIDGHNLAFADDEARLALTGGDPNRARVRVLGLVEIYASAVRQKALVVFDGTGGRPRPESKRGRVRYCHSGANRTADTEIIDRLSQSTGKRETCVVTGDRTLSATARRHGAKTMGVKEFLHEIERLARRRPKKPKPEPAAKRTGPPQSEVEYWLKEFTEAEAAEIEKEIGPGPARRKKRGR
jgi:predicted RNA-binding protein with PIN domain